MWNTNLAIFVDWLTRELIMLDLVDAVGNNHWTAIKCLFFSPPHSESRDPYRVIPSQAED